MTDVSLLLVGGVGLRVCRTGVCCFRVWDIETLEEVKKLEGHQEAVLALALGDMFLVSGSYDTTVRFWDLDTLRSIRKCEVSPWRWRCCIFWGLLG